VDAFRVEGIAPPPGEYGEPLMLTRLILFVVIGADPILFRPPLKFIVDAFRVEAEPPPPGGYGALLIVFTFILFVLI
jgi:hypothetical protein